MIRRLATDPLSNTWIYCTYLTILSLLGITRTNDIVVCIFIMFVTIPTYYYLYIELNELHFFKKYATSIITLLLLGITITSTILIIGKIILIHGLVVFAMTIATATLMVLAYRSMLHSAWLENVLQRIGNWFLDSPEK
ncbi:MAG: hypothetical protein K2P99_07345 [Burkholderiales bacterium]|nr:hypothetical protein [Burkholderiales bacterium]